MAADSVKALFHPFATGALAIPPAGARILYINGRACAGLDYFRGNDVIVQQHYRPLAKAVEKAGWKTIPVIPEDQASYDMVLVSGTRQQEENMYNIAAGLRALRPGGLFLCAASNDAGGKRLRAEALSLGVDCVGESKYKSRVIWAEKPAVMDETAIGRAIASGSRRTVPGTQYISCPGLFCWDRIDEGSALLAAHLPGLEGRGADFGCGWGYLTLEAARKFGAAINEIFCLDADARAVDCCRHNTASLPFVHPLWVDMGDKGEDVPQNLDWIIMNPPFHDDGVTKASAGKAFIERAADALRPGGILWMVANIHLPYEETLRHHFGAVDMIAAQDGYKIFKGIK